MLSKWMMAAVLALGFAAAPVSAHDGKTHEGGEPPPAQPLALAAIAAKSNQAGAPDEQRTRAYFTDLPLVNHDGEVLRFYSDVLKDRVIEVDRRGDIVWQVLNVPNVHDADRLPNGNTLLTIRMLNEVREVDKDGEVVSRIRNLSSPSDADRLPDGRTIVAENGFVRIFDKMGDVVWKKVITWAVEVNPVWVYQREAQKAAGGK